MISSWHKSIEFYNSNLRFDLTFSLKLGYGRIKKRNNYFHGIFHGRGGGLFAKKINSTTIKGSSKPDLIGLKHKQIKRLH